MSDDRAAVAIVGVHVRAPGAPDAEQLWRLVSGSRPGLTEFDRDDLVAGGLPREEVGADAYVPVRGVVPGVELFDPESFGMRPREAELTDPQHRLLLEGAWDALERSGHAGETRDVAVFVGTGLNYYFLRHILANRTLEIENGLLPLVLANEKDHAAAKIAYRLGLTGPAVTVQNACSTSLVAVHLAVRALRSADAQLALAGGATVALPQESGYTAVAGGILSSTGRCRPFRRGRDGTVPGNGVAVLALRLLRDAEADGDDVLAVIRGSAVTNDGDDKVGYTAPGISGQVEVLRRAYRDAGVDPGDVDYVETHGTGTAMGDAIELAALAEVFPSRARVSLGAVKANVGHLDAAAGAVGLVTAALALRHRVLPPLLGSGPVDEMPAQFGHQEVPAPWPAPRSGPRRAGVSSFGLGGTNAHVVLEEYRPAAAPAHAGDGGAVLVPVSARTVEMAERYRDSLVSAVAATSVLAQDVAHTFTVGRRSFPARAPLVLGGAAAGVEGAGPRARLVHGRAPEVVLVFGGQGTDLAACLDGLAQRYPVVADTVADLAALPDEVVARVRHLLLDEPPAGQGRPVVTTQITQLAAYVAQVAVARVLEDCGAHAVALCGHSIGEYAAAHLAGEFSFGTGLGMILARGEAMAEAGPGAMLAVALPEHEARRWTSADVSIAAVNGPGAVVLSGPEDLVAAAEQSLAAEGAFARRLAVPHAFHSPMMGAPAARFARALAEVRPQAPGRTVVSTVTGDVVDGAAPRGAGYWSEQIVRPVLFERAIRTLDRLHPGAVLVEIGPGRQLSNLVRAHEVSSGTTTLPLLLSPGLTPFLRQVGQLWAAGVPVEPARVNHGQRGRRIPLPTYPFDRGRFWVDVPAGEQVSAGEPRRPARDLVVEDHHALPAAGAGGAALAVAEVDGAAETDLLTAVVDAWRQALGVDEVAAGADFYALGGDSLTMVTLATGISDRTGRAVRATHLLQTDLTPQGMADVVDTLDPVERA